MRELLRHQAWIVLAGLLVFFTNLGVPPLWDEDEPKNAECAREMLARADWVVPTFNGELRSDKPALLYWLMMVAYLVFGVNEFSARVWSATFAIGTTLATYHIGRLLFRAQVGLWAGIIMASSLMFVVAGRAATPDSALIFFTTLALLAYVRSGAPTLLGSTHWRQLLPLTWSWFALAYAAMGVGVLAKGPVAVVLPVGVLMLYLLCMHSRLDARAHFGPSGAKLVRIAQTFRPRAVCEVAWALRPFTAVAIVAAIALPWYVCVGRQTEGAWLAGFLGKHNLDRFLSPMEGHKGPIFYYIPAIFAGFFPWSAFLPLSLAELTRRIVGRHASHPGCILLACWAGLYVGFFSLAGTKLPSYVLPAYPALALLTALWIDRWVRGPATVNRRWLRLSLGSILVAGLAMAAGLVIASGFILPGEALLGLVGLVPIAGAGLALWHVRRGNAPRAARSIAVAAICFAIVLFGFAAVRVGRHQNSAPLVQLARHSDPHGTRLATFDYNTPSLVFYARQRVPVYYQVDDVRQFFQDDQQVTARPCPLLITHAKHLETLKPALPPDVIVVARQRRFLRRTDVVLLGRPPHMARQTARGPQ